MARFINVDVYWVWVRNLGVWHFEETEQAIFEAFCDFCIETRSIELDSNFVEVFKEVRCK